ncbi:PilC/PilY family type IV pilus protein [Pseudomonas sp. MYb185]|uniref:PilC/PilY family type IV pilus protein n=1 Tax=Pseudomonas sp. MYb185 TaxID=1848729 RepID=UPI001304A8AE|nr:PilC/PilY family type IV pilus protein [Pseudomonas sp. MYb185]
MKHYAHFLRLTLTGALLAGMLSQAALSYADDTEIFFGGALAEEGIRPNVLFLLDDSSSMNCSPSNSNCSYASPQAGSRLEVMKDSFRQIVNNSTGINIGVMIFNSNPRLVAEVDYIDRIIGDTTIMDHERVTRITAATDDASQTETGSNNSLNEQSLIIGGSASQIIGLRFQDLPIPKNATILEARLGFTPSANGSDTVTLQVFPEIATNASTYAANTAGRLSSRPIHTQSITGLAFPTWTPGSWAQDVPVPYEEGPDVTAQLQAIVNSTNWCGNNAAALQIRTESGTGTRQIRSFDSASEHAPALWVRWQASGVTGCINPILESKVSANNSDGIQTGTSGNSRSPNLTGPTLEFGNGRHIAARFAGISIPQGATILSAQLISTSAAASGATTTTTAAVSIENSVSPAALGTGNNNFSSRSRISDTNCDFVRASTSQVNSCTLTSQVQTLVNKSNWSSSGSSIVTLIRPSSAGPSLIAHDQNTDQAMRLRIKYQGEAPRTYRETLISEVDKLRPPGGNPFHMTPIVPTLYGAATYLRGNDSPITSACQPTHIVLLSDGVANDNNYTSSNSLSGIGGPSCATSGVDNGERCGREIAKHLAENDQASWIEGANNYVTTHTIGFALNASNFNKQTCTGGNAAARFLCDIAKQGGGGYYGADNASELTEAFDEIIRSVISTDASFVSASAPVNSFNRLDNRDELYFAVFRPQETDRWPGNLKRYKVDVDGVRILDAAGNVAVDPNTGFFSSTSRSFWSTETDGNQTSLGGAASKLPTPRNLYTYTGNNPNNTNLTKVAASTNLNTELGATNDTERQMLINYLLGWEGGVANSTQRKAMGDPLHSSPRLITYKEDDSVVVIGTNEGMIHVVNTKTGIEELAFIPKALLPNVKELMENGPSSVDNRRPYGMDNTVTVWANDVNGNGSILNANGTAETGEFVYAYATMGRGGRNLYALDLTNRGSPRLLWEIIGGTTSGFETLGQTWSTPVRTKIQIGTPSTSNPPTDVLIFAGGYDPEQDNQAEGDTTYVRREDAMGNALYIVNAKTGELIWSATGTTHSKMKYSMPSPVRVIDLQQNAAGQLVYDSTGTADQIFVGDMGGQIWRFYINNGQSTANLITPANGDGVMAELGGNGVNARRFYHAPDVALVNDAGTIKLTVNIGSGYRGHPLHTVIQDRFYSLQTAALTQTTNEGLITESSLADLTSIVADEAANTALENKSGWLIKLGTTGEKVLSAALTVNNIVYFNTYEPTAIADSCQANVGVNRAYSVKLRNAAPARNTTGVPSASDRFTEVSTSGLLPDPVVVSIGGKNVLVRFPSIEPLEDEPEPSNYWIDITESN